MPIPEIPGLEGSGIVADIGEKAKEARHLNIGDPVCFLLTPGVFPKGCYAEYVVVDSQNLSLKPQNLSK